MAKHVLLSDQQLTILFLMSQGRSNASIGSHFGVSEDSAKGYVSAIYRLLDARDRAHAVYIGCRDGHIPMPTPPGRQRRRAG